MVPVAQQDLGPFIDDRRVALGVKLISPIRIFAPYHVAKLVSPIEESRLEDFLMQARAIEAAGQAHLDVLLQRLIGRRRPQTLGIESLVEDQALEKRLTVDQYFTAVDGELAQAEITFKRIDDRITAGECDLQIIQERRAGFPQFLLR